MVKGNLYKKRHAQKIFSKMGYILCDVFFLIKKHLAYLRRGYNISQLTLTGKKKKKTMHNRKKKKSQGRLANLIF